MRKRVPFGRGVVPEVKLDPLHFRNTGQTKYWSCERKRKFKTEKNALEELRRIKKRGLLVQNAITYRCLHCGKWHLGHKMSTTSTEADHS